MEADGDSHREPQLVEGQRIREEIGMFIPKWDNCITSFPPMAQESSWKRRCGKGREVGDNYEETASSELNRADAPISSSSFDSVNRPGQIPAGRGEASVTSHL